MTHARVRKPQFRWNPLMSLALIVVIAFGLMFVTQGVAYAASVEPMVILRHSLKSVVLSGLILPAIALIAAIVAFCTLWRRDRRNRRTTVVPEPPTDAE